MDLTKGLGSEHLQRLLAVGRGLVSKHDLEAVLEQVIEAARELTGARYAALGVLDADKHELARFLTVGIDEDLRQRIGPLPLGRGILGELIRNPEPLRLRRISDHPRSYGFPAEHPRMDTFLGVPVMIDGEVFGNLYLTEKANGEEFDERDEQLVIVLAQWAAIAIDNARSLAISQRRRDELERAIAGLEATVSLNREVGGETDLVRVQELVAKRGRALGDARSAVLLLATGSMLEAVELAGEVDPELVGRRFDAEDSPAAEVMRSGRSQVVEGTAMAAFEALGIDARRALLVPLRSRGADLGLLALFDRIGPDGEFTGDDRLALESFAISAATAIGATRLIEDEKLRLSIASSEAERQRWARELHDETLQELGALNVMQSSALQSNDAEAHRRALAQAQQQVERIIAGLQGLITELRPAALDQLGTGAAVEALADRIASRTGLEIELDIDLAYDSGREPTRHTPELEATVYRTVQEALNNVVKHADATRVRVRIDERNGVVELAVEDDGTGFGTDDSHTGFGLLGMRERLALVGSDLLISSTPGVGTRVSASIPVQRAAG